MPSRLRFAGRSEDATWTRCGVGSNSLGARTLASDAEQCQTLAAPQAIHLVSMPIFPVFVAAALAAISSLSAQSPPSLLYRLESPTPGQRLRLHQQFDLQQQCCGGGFRATGPLEFVIEQHQQALLLAIAPEAVLVDIGRPFATIELERALLAGTDAPDPGYFTVAEVESAIDAMVAAYPTLARKVDLSALAGNLLTHQGRRIYALKVSDHAATEEDEPAIVLAAQHHARELNSPVMVIGAMQRVLAGYATDPAMQALIDGHEIYFVPMVNPDGVAHVWSVDANWRKNRRNNGSSFGVDLNRNYPFLWGQCGASTLASASNYRGPAPASEPETVVLRNLVELLRPEIYLDFHSFGQQVLRMWAPCATVSPVMMALQQRYCDDLRTPMNYGTRDPSASGEAPEDHYASGGTLSFLVEVGTSFQPAFSSTQTEENRVWPGIRRALTAWTPALRGHVRSSLGNAPLTATITFRPNQMNHGEVTRSRARDGRYGLWLPLGSWLVDFSAPGHQTRTVAVDVTQYDAAVSLDVLLEPNNSMAVLTKVGDARIGTAVTFHYSSPGQAGQLAFFGWSLSTAPGIQLGGGRVLPLNGDFLFEAAFYGNPILSPTWQLLDANATAQSVLQVPNAPWVVGLTSYVAGITWNPAYHFGIATWSAPVTVTPIP